MVFFINFFFCSSLILCTFLQQFPSVKIARRCQFIRNAKQLHKLKNHATLKNFFLPKILFTIKQNDYLIFQQKNISYCYKGLIGRIAPILVHFSMILIFIGTIFGSLAGFKAQEIIPTSETFHVQNILTNGKFSKIGNTSTRINDFWILYNPDKTISQFYSDISILNFQGKEVKRKTISVNSPLIHKNIYYYQTDWNLIGLRIQTKNNQIFQYPLLNFLETKNKIGLSWINTTESFTEGIIFLADNLEGYGSIYSKMGNFLGNLELQESTNTGNSTVFLENLVTTGLQIKNDPGIPMIYLGFFFLMLSTLLSYITYSQIWLIFTNKQLFIGGTTNRASFEFELEFLKIFK